MSVTEVLFIGFFLTYMHMQSDDVIKSVFLCSQNLEKRTIKPSRTTLYSFLVFVLFYTFEEYKVRITQHPLNEDNTIIKYVVWNRCSLTEGYMAS